MNAYRQGDVVIKKIEKLPDQEFKKKKELVLAEGEQTGHMHRIVKGKVELLVSMVNTVMFLKVLSDYATLFHEEHEDVVLPEGDYEVIIQREFDWFSEEVRRVVD